MTNFRIKITGKLGGVRPWSMGWKLIGTMSEATLSATFNAAATALVNTATDGLQALCCADVSFDGTEVATQSATWKEVSKTVAAIGLTGTASGNSLPWDTAFIVRYLFPGTKKSERGLTHLPPMAQSTLATHVMVPTVAESLQDVFDVFFPAIHAGGAQSVVYNRLTLRDGTPPFTQEIATNYEISDKPGSVARRAKKISPTYYPGGAF